MKGKLFEARNFVNEGSVDLLMAQKNRKFHISFILLWIYEALMFIALVTEIVDIFTTSNQGQVLLSIVEVLAGILLGFLPLWVGRWLRLNVPQQLYSFYVIFLFGSISLGTFLHFYSVPYWDKMLHLVSSSLEVCLGLALLGALVAPQVYSKLSMVFVTFYGLCFAVFCGVLWEFYEFTCDSFGMNLQRYILNGQVQVGRAALMDTMTDLIADFAGAFIFCVYLYLRLRKDPNKLQNFFFTSNQSATTRK